MRKMICKNCQKEFETNKTGKIYCSIECRNFCNFRKPSEKIKKMIPEEVLIELSVDQKKTDEEIGKMYGLSSTSIWRYRFFINLKSDKKKYIGKLSKNWTGYEGISGAMWAGIIAGAKTRKIEFNLTIQEAWDKYIRQQGKCCLTSINIPLEGDKKDGKYLSTECCASLDRIDSKKGYTKDNIQWIYYELNAMKMDLPNDKFIELCKLVCKNNQ